MGWEEVTNPGYPRISGSGHSPATNHPHQPTRTPRARVLRIGRWGNVLAVRLPQALSELLHLQLGDELQLQLLASGRLMLTPQPRRSRVALCDALQTAANQW